MPIQSNAFSFTKEAPSASNLRSNHQQTNLIAPREAGYMNPSGETTAVEKGMNETINIEAYQAYYNTNEQQLNKSMADSKMGS